MLLPSAALVFAAALDVGCASAPTGEGTEPAARRIGDVPISGIVTTRAVARGTEDDTDVDLFGFADVDIGDPEQDDFTGRVSGRFSLDLDSMDGDVFDGINDAYDSALQARIYDAYAQWHGSEDVPLVRVGRQRDLETPEPVLFDGVRVESRDLGSRDVRVGLYGGLPTHYFESSASGDALVGGYVLGRPWESGRVRLDWIHAEDDREGFDLEEDLFGLSIWQNIARELRLRAAYTFFADESRDIDLRATWFEPELELMLQATYYHLFKTQSINPLEFETFSNSLFDYFPFHRLGLLASKRFADRVDVQAGLDLREVEDEDDEGSFNRDVQRYFLTTTVDRVLTDDTSVSVTGDLWQSDAQDTQSLGFDVTHRFTDTTRGSVGTRYAVYDFDQLLLVERENVRTYYVTLDHDLREDLRVGAGYDFQNADVEDFHTLRVKLSWRF